MYGVGERPFELVRGKLVSARIEVLAQLAKFSREEQALRPARGKWTPLQVANHLYICDGLILTQMRRVQSEENPLLPAIEEDASTFYEPPDIPLTPEVVLNGMAARREELYHYLSTLPAEVWRRPFRHPEWGQCAFYQLIDFLIDHDQLHAHQLVAMKAARQ
uniref:DinB-like domain-containing protein n=1 Tax=Thermosporothrix sp. COM3 TaxID=2490863 RepID=A0A455SPF5_9CHLR|nr:hypothetical protein KTC_42710 [Thermosporothrix sp. COM3]